MGVDPKGLQSIRSLKKALQRLPITTTARIAAGAAPAMSTLAQGAHASGQTVYGRPRPKGVDGGDLSLERTGATARALSFIATGRDIRTTLLPRYAKYLIGKYDLLPNGPLPQAWRDRLSAIAARVLEDEVRRP
ncbi:MAG TPA: hypothetical protein VGK73_34000 [Polyangiaceae bacterium]